MRRAIMLSALFLIGCSPVPVPVERSAKSNIVGAFGGAVVARAETYGADSSAVTVLYVNWSHKGMARFSRARWSFAIDGPVEHAVNIKSRGRLVFRLAPDEEPGRIQLTVREEKCDG